MDTQHPTTGKIEYNERKERKSFNFGHGSLERERKWVYVITTCYDPIRGHLPQIAENAPFAFLARATKTKTLRLDNPTLWQKPLNLAAANSPCDQNTTFCIFQFQTF
ncbi:hypothetical protein RHGRI_001518 [Rhododendron griersonianum]|uniref:Uncharacterized protein n=1 Tax=Rhododendron griersonianum TaxID=479676 RepID=A0AAV6LNL9_9ERIC|nr:hypothetical protein RHGRI_001518 [Rhododendron griersonianum]